MSKEDMIEIELYWLKTILHTAVANLSLTVFTLYLILPINNPNPSLAYLPACFVDTVISVEFVEPTLFVALT